jgi:tetratricopeptide (TPR) repeat protein
MFHIARWRERFRDSLRELNDGRPVTGPPEDIDAFNERELAEGATATLSDTSARADRAFADVIDLWKEVGERPMTWYVARTTGDAVIRNSYHHPRIHITEHLQQRGDRVSATRVLEESAADLRRAEALPHTLGAALYNLSLARVADGRHDEAIALLEEALRLRPEIRAGAAADLDLAPLRGDPRFQAMLSGPVRT